METSEIAYYLPALIPYNNDKPFIEYVEDIYDIFASELENVDVNFKNSKMVLADKDIHNSKPITFWHIVCGDQHPKMYIIENVKPARCMYIKWIKALICLASDCNKNGCYWETKVGNKNCSLISDINFTYLIVLKQYYFKNIQSNVYMLLTAYPLEFKRRKDELKKEYRKWQELNEDRK